MEKMFPLLVVVFLCFVPGAFSQDLYPYEGSCVSIEGDTLFFCQNIEYNFFLAEGDSVYEVEQRAMASYFSASLAIDSCCLLAYKDYICSALLPMCMVEDGEAYPLHTCSNWLCDSKISDGVVVSDCFSCDSYPLSDSPCSCPIGNTTDNDDCLPWEVYSCLDNSSSLLAPGVGLLMVLVVLVVSLLLL